MTIRNNLTPATVLKAAATAACAGLAVSAREITGNPQSRFDIGPGFQGRSLKQGPTQDAPVPTPPAPSAMPPPATTPSATLPAAMLPPPAPAVTTPPPGAKQPPPAAQPPANAAPPQSPTQPGTPVTPPAVPGSAARQGCQYGDSAIVDEYALSCYLGCLFTTPQASQGDCLTQLAVLPGPNPQPGMTWCPFIPETELRLYLTAKECSDDCYAAAQYGMASGTYGFTMQDVGLCQSYKDQVPPDQQTGDVPRGVVGPITMDQDATVCLDTMAGSNANGTTVNVFHCNGTPSQEWTITSAANIISGGRCLDIIGGAGTPGAFLEIADCNGSKTQQWWVQGKHLSSKGENACIDTLGGLTYDYISAVVNPCDPAKTSQMWNS